MPSSFFVTGSWIRFSTAAGGGTAYHVQETVARHTGIIPRSPEWRFVKKGDKIRRPYLGAHIRMNVTGMVKSGTGEFYAREFSHSDTEIFQIFLEHTNRDILFERSRTLLILDNASWQESTSLDWGWSEPIFLPPHSPDLNPIERLWLIMKTEWFSGFYAKTKDQLIDRLTQALRWLIGRKDQNTITCAIPTEL